MNSSTVWATYYSIYRDFMNLYFIMCDKIKEVFYRSLYLGKTEVYLNPAHVLSVPLYKFVSALLTHAM